MSRHEAIRSDFTKNWFIILILCIGMIPEIFNGYSQYLLVLLFPLILTRGGVGKSFLVLIFGIIYTLFMYMGGIEQTPSALIFNMIYPLILLRTGIYLSNRFRSSNSLFLLYVIIVICLSGSAILSCLYDTFTTGKLINPTRTVLLIDRDDVRAATGYGMMLSLALSCLCLLFSPTNNNFDKRIKLILVSVGVLALFSTIHLLNRTGLVIILISFLIIMIAQRFSYRRIIYILTICTVLYLGYILFLENSTFLSDATELYQARNKGGSSIENLGGRNTRFSLGLEYLLSNPLGGVNNINYHGRMTYAHNIWVDAGLKGGWICLLLLVYFSIAYIKTTFKVYKCRIFSHFEGVFLLLICVIWITQCMVEPVIEGLPQYLWFMMLLWGSLSQLNTNYSRQ